jgi:beta-lactamase class A
VSLASRFILITQLALFAVFGAQADSLDGYPDLRERYDYHFQKQVESSLYQLGLRDAIQDKRLAVALVDITDLEEPRVAAVNGDEMIYAASLPKIAILLGVFAQIEQGKIKLTPAVHESLVQMIRYSSNVEATRMLNLVGKAELIKILQSDRYHRLYDPSVNGGLWVGKEYGKHAAYQRDPLHNLSHGATVMQVARFYYLLETGQLLSSPELCKTMKAIMGEPGIKHKFVKGLADRRDARMYRKSGTWHQWHADSAIVEIGSHRYIIVALANDSHGGQWMVKLAAPLNDLIAPPTERFYTVSRQSKPKQDLNPVRTTPTEAAPGRMVKIPAHLQNLPLIEQRKDAWPARERGNNIVAWALQ